MLAIGAFTKLTLNLQWNMLSADYIGMLLFNTSWKKGEHPGAGYKRTSGEFVM
jgi:hypothetical protein